MSEFTLSFGPRGYWIDLADGRFPDLGVYNVPAPAQLGLDGCLAAGEALLEMGRALLTNIEHYRNDEGLTLLFPTLDLDRWIEVANLCQSAGQASNLVVAALCETSGMLNQSDDARHPVAPLMAAFNIEAALQYLVSIGHNLTNIGFRLCLETPACRSELDKGNKATRRAVSAAASSAHGAAGWLYHSDAEKYAGLLKEVDVPAVSCLALMARLDKAPDWVKASAERNAYFHRWRSGFTKGDGSQREAASQLHGAAVAAAACLGRVVPEFYFGLVASYPKAVDEASGAESPLMTMVWTIDSETGEQLPALQYSAFVE